MCGIFGKVHFHGESISPSQIQDQNNAIRHRGPDGAGYLFVNRKQKQTHLLNQDHPFSEGDLPSFSIDAALAHRRLSIIDLEGGAQPMTNEDGLVWTSFNGEIYNFAELRDILISKGHQFKSDHSDTEVIVHAWEEWGSDMLQHFVGMFALAVLDLKNQVLFLARDRLGIKPLYYYYDKNVFLFASELKAILEDRSIPRDLDLAAVGDYFAYGYIPAPKSIIKGSAKVQAAHFLLLPLESTEPRPEIKRYWDMTIAPRPGSLKENLEQFEGHLERSIRYRCISDVPLGAFLSGGLDSSTVVYYMNQLNETPPNTFSIGVEEYKFSEAALAKELANSWGTNHRELYVTPKVLEVLPELVHQMDEPFADNSIIPTHYLCKMVSQHVTVALSGDGGDELFAGYDKYPSLLKLQNTWDRIPYALRKPIFGLGNALLPLGIRGSGYFRSLAAKKEQRSEIFNSFFPSQIQKKHFRQLGDFPREDFFQELFSRYQETDYLSRLQHLDIDCYMPEDILMKMDKMSMLHSLEVRVPLLDHQLIEWAVTVPYEYKMHGGERKKIIRSLMEKRLPPNYLNRPKTGFAIPIREWLSGELRSYVEQRLLSSSSKVQEFVPESMIRSLLKANGKKFHNPSPKIWNLLLFEEWAQQYL